MVRDKPKPTRKRIKRRSSWKDTLKGYVSGGEDYNNNAEARGMSQSTSSLKVPSKSAPGRPQTYPDEGSLADGESDEDEDFGGIREEDRPISARVVYKYPNGGVGYPRSNSDMERRQEELLIAVTEANTKAVEAVSRRSPEPGEGIAKEPIGTRLTMTSRTGFFQDRIISPSMVCEWPTFRSVLC